MLVVSVSVIQAYWLGVTENPWPIMWLKLLLNKNISVTVKELVILYS